MTFPFVNLTYVLHVSAAMTAFYVVFVLLLARNTFFHLNRFFLLAGVVISFMLPVLPIPGDHSTASVGDIFRPVNGNENGFELTIENSSAGPDAPTVTPSYVLALIYLAGMIVLVAHYGFAVFRLRTLLRKSRVRRLRRARLVSVDTDFSFSFLNILFLSRRQNQRAVIAHERAHIRQAHWVDLLLSSIACILLWFNPVTWMYSRAIRQQHEYLADNEALRHGFPLTDYLDLILRSLSPEKISALIIPFNSIPLKNRINMMTKNKTKKVRTLLYFIIVPMSAIMLFAFGTKETSDATPGKALTIVIDASHGGDDKGATQGSLTEKELSLTFATLVRKACEEKGIHCIMTRTDDRTISLKDRLNVVKSATPDLFISIHFSGNDSPGNGMNVLVSKDNIRYDASVQLGSLLMQSVTEPLFTRSIHHSSALLLKENQVPAVIVELGNMSHDGDRALITDPAAQKKIAGQMADALMKFGK